MSTYVTHQHITGYVEGALGEHVHAYDVAAIADTLDERFGLRGDRDLTRYSGPDRVASFLDAVVDAETFWRVVQAHQHP